MASVPCSRSIIRVLFQERRKARRGGEKRGERREERTGEERRAEERKGEQRPKFFGTPTQAPVLVHPRLILYILVFNVRILL